MSEVDDYESWSPEQLAGLAYVLQINYDPDNIDTAKIITELRALKQQALILADEENKSKYERNEPDNPIGLWEKQIRAERIASRVKTPCHEPVTVITNKDTALMSNNQLAFLPAQLPNGETIYYCLDRAIDVAAVFEMGFNPFTREPLTPDQLTFLKNNLENNIYPKIPVGNYFEEIQDRLLGKATIYSIKNYQEIVDEIALMVENTGLKYEADQIWNFAKELSADQYNLFLKYRVIDQQIVGNVSRDEAALQALSYILNYIKNQQQRGIPEGNTAIMQIGKAIDDFMYMIHHNLTYEQLLEEKGIIEKGHVKELYWKPSFMMENYYSGGEIKERYYVDDLQRKRGILTQYYLNGRIKALIPYENDKINGIIQEFYSFGELMTEATYENGLENGMWYDFYPSGSVRSEINYINGKGEGSLKFWYTNARIAYERLFTNNTASNSVKLWDQNGLFMGEREWVIEESDDGEIEIFFIESNRKVGLTLKLYDNGLYKYVGFYYDGLKEDYWQIYYRDGSVRVEGAYFNDLKTGQWIEHERELSIPKNETVTYSGKYINGKRTGIWTGIRENGTIKSQGAYISGVKEGSWMEQDIDFHSKEWLTYSGNYNNGKKVGEWTVSYENGSLKEKGYYSNNRKDGLWQIWYENGQLQAEGFYMENDKSGIWKTWHDNGQLHSQGNYIEGWKYGHWTYWDKQGQITEEANYEGGYDG